MSETSRLVITLVLVASLSVGAVAGESVAAEPSVGTDASAVSPPPNSFQESANESNDSTNRHVNPGELEREEDLSHVQSWLAQEMSSRLEESSSQMQEGQYESARRLLGDDYEERYSQYRDVAEQVRGERASEETESVGRLQEEQREFLAAVQTYETTYEEFEEATDNGSDERARRLARQLQRAEDRVNDRSDSLIETYQAASNNTEMNLSENEQITRNISENVSERQREIAEELFVQTELTATAEDETASFTDPLVIRGRLRAENGSDIGNEDVTFRVGNRTLEAQTNDTGGFNLEYAPTTLPTNTTEIPLEYVPDNQSVYEGSNATLPIEITTTDPTIDVTESPDSVAFDEEVVVRGTVQADGKAVSDVPVTLFVGDERLGNGTTTENGSFTVRGSLPAEAQPNGVFRVSLPLENRTLTSANETANVSIRPTGTALTMNASNADNETVRVVGRLRAGDGTPLDNRSIEVKMNGRTLAVVQTERTGVYNAMVTVPESLRNEDNVTVAATFDGNGTNLEPTRTANSVSLGLSTEREQFVTKALNSVASAPWWMFLIVGSVLVPITYGLAGRFGSRPDSGGEFADLASAGRPTDAAKDDIDDRREELLPFAREQLAGGNPEKATHVVYVAVRRALGERFGLDRPLTHWEFFAGCRDAGIPEDRLEALRQVIQAEERAQFGPSGVPANVAERALREATLLVEDDTSTSDHAKMN